MACTKASWEECLEEVREALEDAVSIAWDGCHKIYILLDEEQHQKMIEYGYDDPHDDGYLQRVKDADEAMLQIVESFNSSCCLRFVQSVRSVPEGENENDGFTSIIPQCWGMDEDED